ncbi:MAG TPA: glycosyltransferase family 2 protein [Vicinamibacterales bacterium]|nr:glycosyltransferase family 2 protein [Vicinamibacterales bacterium]
MTDRVPAVTVVMTAYNRERFIAEAIESVLGQTFTDFEMLVVDDCSTDGTRDVAADYARRDPRVRILLNERNLGDYPNRNHASRLVRTPYFKFHDSDDVMYAHCLQVMYGMLDREPRAAFALTTSRPWPGGRCPMLLTPRLAYEREFLGSGLFHLGPAAALFRTNFFHSVGGFAERGVGSDVIFWPRACRAGSALLVPADLFHWREHPGQEIRRTANDVDQAKAGGDVWAALFDAQCPLTGETLEQARRNYVFIASRRVYRHLARARLREAAAALRYSNISATQFCRYLRRPRRSPLAGTPDDGLPCGGSI